MACSGSPTWPFADDAERDAYKAELEERWRRCQEARGREVKTSVRAGDAQYFDQLIHDTHKKAADSGYRPAKEGDERCDAELQPVIT